MSAAPRSALGGAIAGATAAALVVGLAEMVVVMLERHLALDLGLLYFTVLAYGLIGVAVGVAIGVGLGVLGAVTGRGDGRFAYAVSGALIFAALVTIIARFRVFRDLFNETFDGAPISPAMFQLGSVVAAVVLFTAAFLVLRAVARRAALATSPVVALGVVALGLAGSAGAMRLQGAAVSPPVRTAGPIPSGPNVILIMVDTLRADHLSSYGYKAISTPSIDALATDGTRFARAYAQASWTRPSVATILTSLYPSSHGAVHKSDLLADAVVTLPEVLQGAGYRTIGFANNANVAPIFNFQQGFDEYVYLEPVLFFGANEAAAQMTLYNQLRLVRERYLSRAKYVENYYQPAEVVTARGLEWIAAHGERPFFMFLHYMDPHDPYFTHPYNGEGLARVANPNPDPALAERYRAAYDGEIVHLDEHLGRLTSELKARGMYDRTLIVLTSDHGEEFQDHGGWWHGTTLYDEQIAVPLIVKSPRGGPAAVVNDTLVSSLDIAPTILAALGVSAPAAMAGKALGLGDGAPAPRDHAFAEQELEGNVLQAYRRTDWKLIQANAGNPRGLPTRQLFDMTRDPREQNDRASSNAEELATLAADLEAVKSRALAVAVRGGQTDIDPGTEERLRHSVTSTERAPVIAIVGLDGATWDLAAPLDGPWRHARAARLSRSAAAAACCARRCRR